MRYVFLLFLVLAFIPAAYAERGETWERISNDDDSFTLRQNLIPYIHDGEKYVPYIYDSDKVHTNFGSVQVHTNGSFSFYDKGIISGTPFQTDYIIVKYADIADLTSWTYPNSLNSKTPVISWNGQALISTKTQAGVGETQYIYMINDGSWQTFLVAKNLSSLTTKVFGFDQIVDISTDTVIFGDGEKNLDNFDGVTFQRDWIENNQAKIIEFMEGYNFHFSESFDYLYSITAYDTGVNASRLVFDFRTNEILLPGETIIIDPDLEVTNTVYYRALMAAQTGTTCNTTGSSLTTTTRAAFLDDSDLNQNCAVFAGTFDITGLPTGSTVTQVVINGTTSAATNMAGVSGEFVQIDNPLSGAGWTDTAANAKTQFDAIQAETTIYNSTTIVQTTGNYDIILNEDALTDINANHDASLGYFDVGYRLDTVTRIPAGAISSVFSSMILEITYLENDPTTANVVLNTYTIGDTAKINGTVTLTGGYPLPITLDSIQILRNGSSINLNNTNSTFTAEGQTVTFGSFWNQMTTGLFYNFTALVTLDNATGSQVTNTTESITSREYNPTYLPAIDSPSTQGNVNATVSRFDSEDSLWLKVNRADVSGGDTWQIECIAQTNAEAAASKNTTIAQSGTWSNTTDTGYFNVTFSGFTNSHAYITCYNDDLLFTLTDFTDSSLALLGIQLFDDSYGSMLGVPVGIFFLVMTAGMATKRTAPTFIILVTGIAGTMATIGFFSFEPLVWGLALVTAMLGIFVNQKIF